MHLKRPAQLIKEDSLPQRKNAYNHEMLHDISTIFENKKKSKTTIKISKKECCIFLEKKIARLNHTNIPEIFKDS